MPQFLISRTRPSVQLSKKTCLIRKGLSWDRSTSCAVWRKRQPMNVQPKAVRLYKYAGRDACGVRVLTCNISWVFLLLLLQTQARGKMKAMGNARKEHKWVIAALQLQTCCCNATRLDGCELDPRIQIFTPVKIVPLEPSETHDSFQAIVFGITLRPHRKIKLSYWPLQSWWSAWPIRFL